MKNHFVGIALVLMMWAVGIVNAYGQAQLQWQPLGGGAPLTQLVAGQTYELHAVGIDNGLDGWIVDFSGGTVGFSAVVEADDSGAWDGSQIPVSGGVAFFDVSVPDQLIVSFMHDTNMGPDAEAMASSQFLCKVTIGLAAGTLSSIGNLTGGLGDTDIAGVSIPVVAGGNLIIIVDASMPLHEQRMPQGTPQISLEG